MFKLFQRKEKTIITIYYDALEMRDADERAYALGSYFVDNNVDVVKKLTLHSDIKALVIELKEKNREEMVDGFFDMVKTFLGCDGYQECKSNKKEDKHYLLLSN